MYLGKSVIILAAVTLVMSNVSAATQEHLVTYRIHEVPDDPQSDVVFVVSLTVKGIGSPFSREISRLPSKLALYSSSSAD